MRAKRPIAPAPLPPDAQPPTMDTPTDAIFAPEDYLDFTHTEHSVLFEGVEHAWEALAKLPEYLQFRMRPAVHGRLIGRPFISGQVYIGHGTVVEQGAMIKGPAWIGDNCEIRNGCYIREHVVVGDGAVLGNSCEFKRCILFDEVQVPHFNYVGDSILGHRAHLGAGVILSNVKADGEEIHVRGPLSAIPTGLRKFGALLGDHSEIGCNAVLHPGSVIGRHSVLYPGIQWRGVLPSRHIVKLRQEQVILARRD